MLFRLNKIRVISRISTWYKINLSNECMRLCMMPVSIFVSRLGIIDLVNKIKIYTNLIKNYSFRNLYYHLNKYVYNRSKNKWCEYICFPIHVFLGGSYSDY